MLQDSPQQPSHGVFRVRADDPDRPFPFESYAAIASYVRHHGRCEVHVATLPYGMWWQELRRSIDLVVAPIKGPIEEPTGVWRARDVWLHFDDDRYAEVAAPYRTAVTWLDDHEQPQPEHA